MKNKNKQKFLRFLKDNNCYKLFVKSFNEPTAQEIRIKNGLPKDWLDFFGVTYYKRFIADSYVWKTSSSGLDIWARLHYKWSFLYCSEKK